MCFVQVHSLLVQMNCSQELLPLQSTKAQSISSQEQVQHQIAKNSQHRDQQLHTLSEVAAARGPADTGLRASPDNHMFQLRQE